MVLSWKVYAMRLEWDVVSCSCLQMKELTSGEVAGVVTGVLPTQDGVVQDAVPKANAGTQS